MQTQPVEQHAWLRRWVGSWSFEGEMATEPGKEPMRWQGVEVVRAVGDLWIVGEMEWTMFGGASRAMLTVGFDPKKGRFVGSWIGSMTAYMWVYDGWLEGGELVLEAAGESFVEPGTMTMFRDITQLVGDDERRFRAMMRDAQGEWKQFMSVVYRRTS
jgi:hypothetical protein